MTEDAKTFTSPSLLSPDNHSLMLVDQQYLVLITMRSHEVNQVIEAMTLLAKGAKLFGVRTLLTNSERVPKVTTTRFVHAFSRKPIAVRFDQ